MISDTHEGIVTQEEFDTVQQLMTSRRREKNKGGFENIFAGVIKCADCGYALRAMSANRRKRPDINRFADMAVNDERAVGAIEKRLTETDQSKAKAMEKERKKLNKRLDRQDTCFGA